MAMGEYPTEVSYKGAEFRRPVYVVALRGTTN